MTVGGWPGRDELARRAKHRFWGAMALTVVVVAILVPLLESRHHTRHTHQHHSVAGGLLVIVVSVLLLIAVGVGVRYVVRPRTSFFAVPIIACLPRRQRRAAGRNVPRGTPSDDLVMANIERETAQLMVTMARYNEVVCLFVTLVAVLQVFIQHGDSRIFYGVCAVVIVAGTVRFRLSQLPKARRYLEAADRAAPTSS